MQLVARNTSNNCLLTQHAWHTHTRSDICQHAMYLVGGIILELRTRIITI